MDMELITMGEDVHQDIMDVICKAYNNIYKDMDMAMLLYGFCLRRKKKKLPITMKYVKWLYKEIKYEASLPFEPEYDHDGDM